MKYFIFGLMVGFSAFAGSPQGVTSGITASTIGTDSTLLLAANKNRGYLIIQNNSSGNCYLNFGSDVSGLNGLVLGAGQNYEAVNAYIKSPVYMKCSGSGASIISLQSNY